MTTERLAVLAGAAALGEFTAPELAAYTGANPNTVRQVLQRELKRHGYFERAEPARDSSSRVGHAVIWKVSAEQRDQILQEISRQEAKIAQLRGAVSDRSRARPWIADQVERAAMFVASAEEALTRSYETADNEEREIFATIASNLLRAANPYSTARASVARRESPSQWWDREQNRLDDEFVAPLETISSVSIESHLRTVQRTPRVLVQEEMLRHRAHRVAAFSAIAVRMARRTPIGLAYLTDAAEAISAGSTILPVPQTLSWIKVFVDASIASGNPAPVAILSRSTQPPDQLFPVGHSAWRRVRPPAEFAQTGYWLWVESWAETLLERSLIPGVVVAHDGSPESDETLTKIMQEREQSELGRPMVVASTTGDSRVARQVAVGGGIFFPINETVDDLLRTVNRVVVQGVSATPSLAVSYWMASGIYREPQAHDASASTLDILRTATSSVVRPADLEVAQQTLAVFDDAVKELDSADRGLVRQSSDDYHAAVYVDLVRRLAERLSRLGGSRHALAVAEEALSNYQRMIEFKWYGTRTGAEFGVSSRHAKETELRREIARDMAWAYGHAAAGSETADVEEPLPVIDSDRGEPAVTPSVTADREPLAGS